MKRCTVKAKFPDLQAHRSELTASAGGTNTEAAAGKALRKLLRNPLLHKKQIHSFSVNFSFVNIDMEAVERMMAASETKPDAEEPEPATSETNEPAITNGVTKWETPVTTEVEAAETPLPEPQKNYCRRCEQTIEGSLARHVATCGKGKQAVSA